MSVKYDVMITNPPYLGTSAMEPAVKDYAAKNYPNSKADLFAMFMETEFVRPYGFTAMINMHAWMFLSTYEKLRIALLSSKTIITMAHLGARAFETISGEVVQTTTFILQNAVVPGMVIPFEHLLEPVTQQGKEMLFLEHNNTYYAQQSSFSKIDGRPIVYTVPERVFDTFNKQTVSAVSDSRCGMNTGDNDSFISLWHEISYGIFRANCDRKESLWETNAKYAVYNKGGIFRKWYGNLEYVIKFDYNSYQLLLNQGNHLPSRQYYFEPCITWTDLSTKGVAFRFQPQGSVFDGCAATAFPYDKNNTYYLLGLLNSAFVSFLAPVLNPTLHFKLNDYGKIPWLFSNYHQEKINNLVRNNIALSKNDWDAFETSWDFKVHPLVELCPGYAWGDNEPTRLISAAYNAWERLCEGRFQQLKANEEELNRIFIDIYGLQDELTPEVKDEDVTVRLADKERDIKSLISYLVGLIMGRYSLDVEGLAYAGGDWDATKYRRYQPDDDGIVPIYAGLGMEDGLTARVFRLIKLIYGANSYRQNIDFIAEALGKKSSESSEETLNRYLNDGFYADHLKIYQKRPIYWLFSSGKHSGFKCLIYMHRYNADTLARINGKYFLPESARLKNELDELLLRINRAEGRDRVRLEKERQKLAAAYNEALEYGQILDHMANKYIAIDLDDGVKDNYAKFQGVELVTDSGTKVKKDLLSPIK